jgi:hypothetical protein
MTRFARFLRALLILSFCAIAVAYAVRFSNVGAPTTLSKLSIALIVAGAMLAAPLGAILALWRRRGQNRGEYANHIWGKYSRSPLAVGFATAVLGAGACLMIAETLLPSPTSATTSISPGGRVVSISSGSRTCLNQVRIDSGSSRIYLCACHRGICVRGFDRHLSIGDRVDIEKATNSAGSRIVGLVHNGA